MTDELWQAVADAAHDQRVTRSEFVRQAVLRQLVEFGHVEPNADLAGEPLVPEPDESRFQVIGGQSVDVAGVYPPIPVEAVVVCAHEATVGGSGLTVCKRCKKPRAQW